MDPGAARELMRMVVAQIDGEGLAAALISGRFGQNSLALSSAVNRLDLGGRLDAVIADVRRAIEVGDYSQSEADLFNHMVEVHRLDAPEPALVDADSAYRQVASAAEVTAEEAEHARRTVGGSGAVASASAVRTMLALLDQQTDHDLYCAAIDNLARTVAPLLEAGDVELASKVVSELAVREGRQQRAWPDFAERLRAGVALATGERSMSALVAAAAADGSRIPAAQALLRSAGGAADGALAKAAVSGGDAGIAAVETIVGRRVLDLLVTAAASAPVGSVASVVERLAIEADARALATVRQLLARSDDSSRKAAIAGLRAAGGPHAVAMLSELARGESPDVAALAIRALGSLQTPQAAGCLSELLGELDVDTKDFAVAREVIGALARVGDPVAVDALRKLTERKVFIKRGHFAEIQQLGREALEHAARGGGVA
jgi:hypothetical protein